MDSSGNLIDRERSDYQSSFQDITPEQIGHLLRMLKNLVSPKFFDLSNSEIEGFLSVDIREYHNWIARSENNEPIQLSDDALCRICLMFDIYQLIGGFFGNRNGMIASVLSWPNRKLNGLSAKQRILKETDSSGLLAVWEYFIRADEVPGYISMKMKLKRARDCNQPAIDPFTALKLALDILKKWGSNRKQIGRILNFNFGSTDAQKLPEIIPLDEDQLLRIKIIRAIDYLLRHVFSNPDNIDGFMGKINHNSPFNGVSPLMYINSGEMENLKRAHDHIWGISASQW